MTRLDMDSNFYPKVDELVDLLAGRIQRLAHAEFESLRRSIGQRTRLDHFRRKQTAPVPRKPRVSP